MSETYTITYTRKMATNDAFACDGYETVDIDATSAADATSAFKCLYPSATVSSVKLKRQTHSHARPIDFSMDGVPI